MDELNLLQRVVVWALPVLFAITVHETAHGWMALRLGDPTAMMLGRLSINPIKHIDPIGTVLVPGVLLLLGGFLFGWAKPVPITYENLRHPKRDMALVAAAGPLSNLVMALFWALVIRLGLELGAGTGAGIYLVYSGVAGIFINTILMVLNLLPLPPLDGGRVLVGVLPGPLSWRVSRLEPYGFPILLVLLFTGLLGKILWPVIELMLWAMSGISGLSGELYIGLLSVLMNL
ncbi:site-2 protease family protein [Sulfurivermis fontis]|uniref:site-2 protease family protein n=1 Tax=Sulfurivermis fontis TaxID=1972068 RepID=UPI000FDB633D|nr:site-2 protease family protein [Sulfurivermis fontis]